MANFGSIADTADSLRQVLQEGLDETFTGSTSRFLVTLDSPKKIEDDSNSDERLISLFIYEIMENRHLKNRPPTAINATLVQPAPLYLDLHLLLTVYGNDPYSQYRALGRAMQIMHESPQLHGAVLRQQLEGTTEQINISFNPQTQDMIGQVWQSMELSLRPAAFYSISPVIIIPDPIDSARRIRERNLDN